MIHVDDNLLLSIGLEDLPIDDRKTLLQDLLEELQLRVGRELSKNLADEQLQEFEQLDQAQGRRWLEANCPNYELVVEAELEKLKQELIARKHDILER